MKFDYKVAAAIAGYEPVHTERLRDFAHAARQTWDELQLSKRENISLQREIRNLLGEIDVLKSSLLEAEASPQPVVPELTGKQWSAMRTAIEECAYKMNRADHIELRSAHLDAAPDAVYQAMLSAGKENTE